MLKKFRFKLVTISCVISIALTLGMASVGYCGGGFGERPDRNLFGPSVIGKVIIKKDLGFTESCPSGGDADSIGIIVEFHGNCGGQQVDIECLEINSFREEEVLVPDSMDDMEFFRVPNAQAESGFVCLPAHGGDKNDDLIIRAVSKFNVEVPGICISAFVVLQWDITPE